MGGETYDCMENHPAQPPNILGKGNRAATENTAKKILARYAANLALKLRNWGHSLPAMLAGRLASTLQSFRTLPQIRIGVRITQCREWLNVNRKIAAPPTFLEG